MKNYNITLIPGDGIGKEVTSAAVKIIEATGININWEIVNVGQSQIDSNNDLIPESVYNSIEKNKVILKGPLMTPIGTGFRSLNVYLRKKYELFANIRPINNLYQLEEKKIDMIIFRENTEGLYIGLEEEINKDERIAIKKTTRKGCEKIIYKAFEYAKVNNINKVTLVHKANILKLTDGLFLEIGREISKEYKINLEEIIVDNMCMQMVMNPSQFNVIVTMNLYGDILSDLGAGLVGGLGLIPSGNIGDEYALFEAVHGSAPDIANKNIANPIAITLAGAMMLEYLGEYEKANLIKNAVYKVLEQKIIKTKDLGGENTTTEITEEIIREMRKNDVK